MLNLTMSDEVGVTVLSTISITNVMGNFVAQLTVIYLDLSHSSRGDLDIELASPQGTVSLLVPGRHPENSSPVECWKLMTLSNWGESPVGDWTLSFTDRHSSNYKECIDLPYETNVQGFEIYCGVSNCLRRNMCRRRPRACLFLAGRDWSYFLEQPNLGGPQWSYA